MTPGGEQGWWPSREIVQRNINRMPVANPCRQGWRARWAPDPAPARQVAEFGIRPGEPAGR